MRIGVVSDIHCNVEGLKRALETMGAVDELLCLGDCIYEYRFSNEVVALLRERRAHTIQGNHEQTFFGPLGARARSQDWINPSLMEWLAGRPERLELTLAGKKLLLVHSTPWKPYGEYIYPDHPSLQRFSEVEADVVLFGHTHLQLVRRIGRVLVVNPGSAGDARDMRNGRQLSCAVLDCSAETAIVLDFPDPRF
jgi:putative phosphoesterase